MLMRYTKTASYFAAVVHEWEK